MKIQKQTDNILILYTITAVISILVGVFIDSEFLIILGAVVAVMGGLLVNNTRTKHITNILKQNNLWTDDVFEKK